MTNNAIDVKPKTQSLADYANAEQNAGMISPAQCRAARGFLNWTQADLARAAQVGKNTLIDFEQAKRPTRPATIVALEKAFTDAGVRFETDAEGRAWVGGVPSTA